MGMFTPRSLAISTSAALWELAKGRQKQFEDLREIHRSIAIQQAIPEGCPTAYEIRVAMKAQLLSIIWCAVLLKNMSDLAGSVYEVRARHLIDDAELRAQEYDIHLSDQKIL